MQGQEPTSRGMRAASTCALLATAALLLAGCMTPGGEASIAAGPSDIDRTNSRSRFDAARACRGEIGGRDAVPIRATRGDLQW